jgi:hypothetical protein
MRRTLLPALVALGAAAPAACGGPCGREVRESAWSPDRQWKAVSFLGSCGAMARSSSGVAVLPADVELTDDACGHDVLLLQDTLTRPAGLNPVGLAWTPDGGLVITYDARARVHVLATVAKAQRITYRVE